MKVDIRVPVGLPVLETAEFISECEKAGFSGVGVHDHQHSGRDVFLTLAMAAGKTERLTLYPATSNPVTRHPMVLASLAHTLEEIAPGRVRLTVGPGYLAVGNIGRRRASLDEMRRSILDIRSLLRGERVEFNGVETRLRNVSQAPTPVFMTAAGPRMVELAGEVADGALLLVGLHPKAVRAARRRLEIGAARAGRDLDAFRTVHITPGHHRRRRRRSPPLAAAMVQARPALPQVPQRLQPGVAAGGRYRFTGQFCAGANFRLPGRRHLRRFRAVRHRRGIPAPAQKGAGRIGHRSRIYFPDPYPRRRL